MVVVTLGYNQDYNSDFDHLVVVDYDVYVAINYVNVHHSLDYCSFHRVFNFITNHVNSYYWAMGNTIYSGDYRSPCDAMETIVVDSELTYKDDYVNVVDNIINVSVLDYGVSSVSVSSGNLHLEQPFIATKEN